MIPQRQVARFTASSSTTARDLLDATASRSPFTVQTAPFGPNDAQTILQFNHDLGFEYIAPVENGSVALRSGEDFKNVQRARIRNLEDADAFLGFAFARGRVGIWTALHVGCVTSTMTGTCSVRVQLSRPDVVPVELIVVDAIARVQKKPVAGQAPPEPDPTAQQAELCAKLELLRTLAQPLDAVSDFLAVIDPSLAERSDDRLAR